MGFFLCHGLMRYPFRNNGHLPFIKCDNFIIQFDVDRPLYNQEKLVCRWVTVADKTAFEFGKFYMLAVECSSYLRFPAGYNVLKFFGKVYFFNLQGSVRFCAQFKNYALVNGKVDMPIGSLLHIPHAAYIFQQLVLIGYFGSVQGYVV